MDHGKSTLIKARQRYVNLLESSLSTAVKSLSSLTEVQRVSLVGSYARGRADLLTDLDLIVVMDTDMPFLERLKFLYGLLALPVDADLLCYTPMEFEALRERPFFRHMLKDEVVLYEKKPP